MQGASLKSSSPPCSHTRVGGDACPHLLVRCCLVPKPFPARLGGETIRLSPTFHHHQLPQTQSPMSHPSTGHPCSVAGTQQLDVLPKPRLTAAQVSRMVGATVHAPPQAWYQQTPQRHGAGPVPTAQDSSSPCLHPVERKNSLVRGKHEALCRVGPAAGFLKARKRGPILHCKVTFRRTLRMLICLPRPLCPPRALHCCRGYLWLCLSHKWEKDAGALPAVFRPKLQAMAQLSLLSASSEQG